MNKNKNIQNNILKGGSLAILVFGVLIISFAFPASTEAFYASCTASPSTANVGQNVVFTANVNPSGSYTYIWSGACAGSGSTCQKQFSAAGTYTANLQVSGNGGSVLVNCSVTINSTNPNPNPNSSPAPSNSPTFASCTASSSTVTVGQPVTFTTDVLPTGGSYRYYWSGCTSSGPTCQRTFSYPTSNYPVSVTVSGNGASIKASCPVEVIGNNANITCSSNSQCGTSGVTGGLFCQGNSVYQNYITYTCQNPGAASSYCTNSTASQLQTTCSGNQTCSNGSCVNNNYNNYVSHSYTQCYNNSVYWYDSNGTRQDVYQTCGSNQYCSGNACVNNYNYNNNYNNYNTYAYTQCSNGDIYWYDSNGTRQGLYKSCSANAYGSYSTNYCVGNSVYQRLNYYTYGCANNSCYSTPSYNYGYGTYVKTCGYNQVCSSGACVTKPTSYSSNYIYHYVKKCDTVKNSVYWYDSYGTKQDVAETCSTDEICSEATCVKKPVSEILGLALTIFAKSQAQDGQWAKNISAGGNQNIDFLAVVSNGTENPMDNVVVTVNLPREILNKGNITIDGVPYSGDATAGIPLGSLALKTTKAIVFTSTTVDESAFAQGPVTVVGKVNTLDGSSEDSLQVNLIKGLQVVQPQAPETPTSNGFLASLLGAGSRNWLYILLAIIIIILIIIAIRRFNEGKN